MEEFSTFGYNEPPYEVVTVEFSKGPKKHYLDMDLFRNNLVASETALSFDVELRNGVTDLITVIKEMAWSENLLLKVKLSRLRGNNLTYFCLVKDVSYRIGIDSANLIFTSLNGVDINFSTYEDKTSYLLEETNMN